MNLRERAYELLCSYAKDPCRNQSIVDAMLAYAALTKARKK